MKKRILKISAVLVGFVLITFVGIYANRALYANENIWDIALFRMDERQSILEYDYSKPVKVFSPTTALRTTFHYVTGYADPFLFVDGEWLYIFYEEELYLKDATIHAIRTKDLEHFEDLGEVLAEQFHLSFPNVFRDGDVTYMIPETRTNSTVSLYRATDFPYGWVKEKDLLIDGRYVDSSIYKSDSLYYLFTSIWRDDDEGLRLYVSDSLTGPYHPLPSNPVTCDKANLRMGGGVLLIDSVLYRPAQNCVNYYGEKLDLYKVDSLTPSSYSEHYCKSMIDKNWKWSRYGGHQFSTVIFKGEKIVAMDGKTKDNWFNNRTRKIFEFFHK